MKSYEDLFFVVLALSLSMLFFSCTKKGTEPEINKVATPTFSPIVGTYEGPQFITIKCSTKGATILYTTDGSEPGAASPIYKTPIKINSETTIIAQAFKEGLIDSDIASVSYIINLPTVATPTFSQTGGFFSSEQILSISCATSGAKIYYTTDGSEPTIESNLYHEPILIDNYFIELKAKAFKEDWNDSNTISESYFIPVQMVYVPGGTFTMGETRGGEYSDNGLPTHTVTLNSFYIGKYLVSGSACYNNTLYEPDIYCAYRVSWYYAIKYCNLISIAEGFTPVYSVNGSTDPNDWGNVPNLYEDDPAWAAAICNWDADGYRLPTEAEWEYAARGGTNIPDYLYSGSDDIDSVAWYWGNSEDYDLLPNPIGVKQPNGLGIYDMSGSVDEWCWDWYDGDYYNSSPSNNPRGPETGSSRVTRGGSNGSSAFACRVSKRSSREPFVRPPTYWHGMRLCRSAP